MANYNKIAQKITSTAWEQHAHEGFWKEANYAGIPGTGNCSFMLYERLESEKVYFYIANEWIKTHGDPAGLYTKKRTETFFAGLKTHFAFLPWKPENLAVGQKLLMTAIRDISPRFRKGEVGQIDMLKSDNIIDLVNCVEENGYQDTYGSCYSEEIIAVMDTEGNWHPFEGIKQPKGD